MRSSLRHTAKVHRHFKTRNQLSRSFANTDLAGGVYPKVFCDGASLGQIHSGRFFILRLLPGKHILTSTDDLSQIELDVANGQTYCVEASMIPSSEGGSNRPVGKISLVSNEIGESQIKGLKPK
jgi:hypothetical protein